MSRRKPRGGPLWSLGLWSPDHDSEALHERTVTAFRTVGAVPQRRFGGPHEAPTLVLRARRFPTSPPGGIVVHVLPVFAGSLVEAYLSGAKVDQGPARESQRLVAALAEVVLAVRPALATLSVEDPPEALPYPAPDGWQTLFAAGWVDLEACTPRQRDDFERLRSAGGAMALGPGLWWAAIEDLFPTAPSRPLPPDVAEAAYQAWMRGRLQVR